jgi:hypothetical protein
MEKPIKVVEHLAIGSQKSYHPKDFGSEGGKWSIHCSRLQGGLSDGVEIIDVSTDRLNFVIVPTRGMGLWKATVLSQPNQPIQWKSPVRGPVHPAFVNLGEPSGLGWLDGFDELLVRCGLESNGAPEFDEETGRLRYPLHGRIANKPAHDVTLNFDADRQEISIRGVVEETRFHFFKLRMTSTYTVRLGSTAIRVHDEIENFSASPAEMQLLYHVNFGVPLLDAGARIVGPFQTVVPRNAHAASSIESWDSYQAPEPGFEEQVYFTDLYAGEDGRTRVLLKNAHGTQGVSLVYDVRELPCFSLWKNTTSVADGCVTGLEPATNYPNPRSFEGKQGRTVKLAAGAKTSFGLVLDIHATAGEVKQAEDAINEISKNKKRKLHDKPQTNWCFGSE